MRATFIRRLSSRSIVTFIVSVSSAAFIRGYTALSRTFSSTIVAPLLVFYACDELTSEEREQIVAHLAICDGCRAQLSEEDALQAAIDRMPQVADQFESSGVLLAQCRSELSESLDELSAPKVNEGWRPFGWVRAWMALRPGWSAAALLLVGAIVGTQAYYWLPIESRNGSGPGLKFSPHQNSQTPN